MNFESELYFAGIVINRGQPRAPFPGHSGLCLELSRFLMISLVIGRGILCKSFHGFKLLGGIICCRDRKY